MVVGRRDPLLYILDGNAKDPRQPLEDIVAPIGRKLGRNQLYRKGVRIDYQRKRIATVVDFPALGWKDRGLLGDRTGLGPVLVALSDLEVEEIAGIDYEKDKGDDPQEIDAFLDGILTARPGLEFVAHPLLDSVTRSFLRAPRRRKMKGAMMPL